jgi:predicted peroxiredoxin
MGTLTSFANRVLRRPRATQLHKLKQRLTKDFVITFLETEQCIKPMYGVSREQFWELVRLFGTENANALMEEITIMGVKFYVMTCSLNFDEASADAL